jgi:hypothetical protein
MVPGGFGNWLRGASGSLIGGSGGPTQSPREAEILKRWKAAVLPAGQKILSRLGSVSSCWPIKRYPRFP